VDYDGVCYVISSEGMKNYVLSSPLVFIHIPKAAGSSVREVFRGWFGSGLLENYFDEEAGLLPPRRDLSALHSRERPVVVYGHFNRNRGFGIEDYYPEADQFVTIIRDPFEAAISTYYYMRRVGDGWRDQSRVPKGDLQHFLANAQPNMLRHFPREVTRENYRDLIEEFFVEVGIMEHLEASLHLIAAKLGMSFASESLGLVNASERDQPHPEDMRDAFIDRYPLEIEVYNYIALRFPGVGSGGGAGGSTSALG